MPVLGAKITSASISANYKTVTVVCEQAGDIQYPVCDILVRLNGSGNPFVSVNSIGTWSNLLVIGSYTTALVAGNYDVRIVTSNNQTLTLENVFGIPTGGGGVAIAVQVGTMCN
jgi:uncharacterized protein (DUF2141 family)